MEREEERKGGKEREGIVCVRGEREVLKGVP